jgi:hypothetical protein
LIATADRRSLLYEFAGSGCCHYLTNLLVEVGEGELQSVLGFAYLRASVLSYVGDSALLTQWR